MADLLAVVRREIESSAAGRALVGLAPSTASSLVGWGRRRQGGRGWYLEATREPARLVYVLSAPDHVRLGALHGGARPPVPTLVYAHGHGDAPEASWLTPGQVGALVALPEEDGALLAHLLRDPRRRVVDDERLRALVAACASDPVFLAGALVCEQAPTAWPAPVHEGQYGPQGVAALRAAQAGHELLLLVGGATVEAHPRWGGSLAAVGRRIADVLLARYGALLPRVAGAALTRTIDGAGTPVMPEVVLDVPWADELVTAVWTAWAFGPRASVAQGRELVRRVRPQLAGDDVDRTLVWLLVVLQLATRGPATPRPRARQPAPT